ncbi:MAG TPA: metallopeptidase TldD-related protein, partial [Kofleriaceae bacterium]|nr:metallopeptidase TldD-related protein [Kofleriaceae bacterium]
PAATGDAVVIVAGGGEPAIAKAQASARPARLAPGRYSVVLEPAATAALVRFLTESIDARSAHEGSSWLSQRAGGAGGAGSAGGFGGRLGQRVLPESITVASDPADYAADGRAFDAEGVPQAPTTWIDRGVLARMATDRSWAAKSGQPLTGWPEGMRLEGGTATRDQLIRGIDRGLLITRFFYLGLLDPISLQVTGLTRDGVFLIERGALVGPVQNFRFNHSPVELLARCDGLGATQVVAIDGGRRLRAPLLRSHDFHMTSVSEAV